MAKKNSKKTVPELRFRGFTDPWEQRQLGEVAQRVTRRNLNNECSRVLTASAEAGLIDQQEYFQKRIASHDLSHYYLLKRGDFAYNHSSSGSAALGIIKRLDAYDSGCLSTLYIVFHPKQGIDSDYLLHYFESSAWHGDVAGMVTEGARNHGLLNISPDTFFTARFSFPSLPEQRRIGEFFSTLDSLIAAAERQETLLRRKKRAYLQLMFPQEGETEPRLRFAGFSGEWQQRQLGEVGSAISGVGFPDAEQGGTVGLPFYKVSDMNLSANESIMRASSNYVSVEQLVTNRWKPITTIPAIIFAKVGAAVFLDRKRVATVPFLMDNNMMAYIPDGKSWDVDFCLSVFNRIRLSNLARIGALPSINASDVEQHYIALPDIPEQRRIGEFFSKLDNLIAAAEQRAESHRSLKSAYLQRMFA